MKECILKGLLSGIVKSMRSSWLNKKRSARTGSNANIDGIYHPVIAAGCFGGEVSGAGGGGFMMFPAPPERRGAVVRTLQGFGRQINNCHFTKHGTRAWRH
jgi:D-glycero-alpha-D-manno-heptose-7-phosphate kinase